MLDFIVRMSGMLQCCLKVIVKLEMTVNTNVVETLQDLEQVFDTGVVTDRHTGQEE